VTLVEVLRGARELVARGWAEPVTVHAENGVRYAVLDAIDIAAGRPHQEPGLVAEAMLFLESVALPAMAAFDTAVKEAMDGRATLADVVFAARTPGASLTLQQWLEQRGRQLAEVLAAFDAAILRAKSIGGE
jgi:hypothetical protein